MSDTGSALIPDGHWRRFDIADILARYKTSLDIFWIKNKSLADLDSLPSPDVLADEIIENLQRAGELSGTERTAELLTGESENEIGAHDGINCRYQILCTGDPCDPIS